MSSIARFARFIRLISEKPHNSKEIEAELGINKRTTIRYANALREAGFDVRTSTGGGGGYWLKG